MSMVHRAQPAGEDGVPGPAPGRGSRLAVTDENRLVVLNRRFSTIPRAQAQVDWGVRPALLVVDEVGYLKLDRDEANLFFQLISRRYERGSVIITSNKSFPEWGAVLGDDILATAILDRLLHHCEVISRVSRWFSARNRPGSSFPPVVARCARRGTVVPRVNASRAMVHPGSGTGTGPPGAAPRPCCHAGPPHTPRPPWPGTPRRTSGAPDEPQDRAPRRCDSWACGSVSRSTMP